MKKNTKKIFALALVVLAVLSFAGCGKQNSEEAITEAIEAVCNLDDEKMTLYYGSSLTDEITADGLFTQDVLNALVKNISYKILSVEENDGKSVIEVEFTNIDMNTAVSLYFTEALSYALSLMSLPEDQYPTDEELNAHYSQMLVDVLTAEDVAMITKTATVNMTYNEADQTWTIDNDANAQEFISAMFGGLLEVDMN